MADVIVGADYPIKAVPVTGDRLWGYDPVANVNRLFPVSGILAAATIPAKVLSVDLIISSTTAGTLTASWISNTSVSRSVTSQAVTFIGVPAAGFFRFDNVLGYDDGTTGVQAGTPATTNPAIPTPPSNAIVLKTILWNELGENQEVPGTSPFPENRFSTKIEPGTNGKFAKMWEGNLSINQNFQLHLAYGAPSSSQDWALERPGKSGYLILNFLCDPDSNILTNNVQFVTVDKFSAPGDFRLVQLAGGRAALLHASTDYWMRVEFRVIFSNSAFVNSDFIDQGEYTTLPAGTEWQSIQYNGDNTIPDNSITNAKLANMVEGAIKMRKSSGTGDPEDATGDEFRQIHGYPDFEPSTGNILFSPLNGKPRKYGFTTALTGNIVFETTGAKETIMVKARWNAGTLPTVSVSGGGVTLVKTGDFVISVDNFIDAVCDKNDAGTVTHIRYSISQA